MPFPLTHENKGCLKRLSWVNTHLANSSKLKLFKLKSNTFL